MAEVVGRGLRSEDHGVDRVVGEPVSGSARVVAAAVRQRAVRGSAEGHDFVAAGLVRCREHSPGATLAAGPVLTARAVMASGLPVVARCRCRRGTRPESCPHERSCPRGAANRPFAFLQKGNDRKCRASSSPVLLAAARVHRRDPQSAAAPGGLLAPPLARLADLRPVAGLHARPQHVSRLPRLGTPLGGEKFEQVHADTGPVHRAAAAPGGWCGAPVGGDGAHRGLALHPRPLVIGCVTE